MVRSFLFSVHFSDIEKDDRQNSNPNFLSRVVVVGGGGVCDTSQLIDRRVHGVSPSNLANKKNRSSGGRVVELLACRARGPGFDSRPHHLNFMRLVISCFEVEIWLKDRQIDVNPQNNQLQPSKQEISENWTSPSIFQFRGNKCIQHTVTYQKYSWNSST